MKFLQTTFHSLNTRLLATVAAIFLLAGTGTVRADEEYSFKVENKTELRIVKILVSEDGKKYGAFDIGKGIGAGKTVMLVWDKSTNSEGCKQYVKAVYDDGEESEPAQFDFCEEDLELVFEE